MPQVNLDHTISAPRSTARSSGATSMSANRRRQTCNAAALHHRPDCGNQVDASVDEADVGGYRDFGQAVDSASTPIPAGYFAARSSQVRQAPQVCTKRRHLRRGRLGGQPGPGAAAGLTARRPACPPRGATKRCWSDAALRWRLPGAPRRRRRWGRARSSSPGRKGRPRPVALRTGIADPTWLEVLEGALQPGQAVIIGERLRPRRQTTSIMSSIGRAALLSHGGFADRGGQRQGLQLGRRNVLRPQRRLVRIAEGEPVAVVGPSGSGRISTFMNVSAASTGRAAGATGLAGEGCRRIPTRRTGVRSATGRSASSFRCSTCCREPRAPENVELPLLYVGCTAQTSGGDGAGAPWRSVGLADRAQASARASFRADSSSGSRSPGRWSTNPRLILPPARERCRGRRRVSPRCSSGSLLVRR